MLQWETKPIKLAEGDIVNHQFVQMQHFQESVICSKKGFLLLTGRLIPNQECD